MHDGVQYDSIQGVTRHEPLNVGNSAIYNGGWQMNMD